MLRSRSTGISLWEIFILLYAMLRFSLAAFKFFSLLVVLSNLITCLDIVLLICFVVGLAELLGLWAYTLHQFGRFFTIICSSISSVPGTPISLYYAT